MVFSETIEKSRLIPKNVFCYAFFGKQQKIKDNVEKIFFIMVFFGKKHIIKDNVEKRFPAMLGLDNRIKNLKEQKC